MTILVGYHGDAKRQDRDVDIKNSRFAAIDTEDADCGGTPYYNVLIVNPAHELFARLRNHNRVRVQ